MFKAEPTNLPLYIAVPFEEIKLVIRVCQLVAVELNGLPWPEVFRFCI